MENLKNLIYDAASNMRYTDRNGKDTNKEIMGGEILQSFLLLEDAIIKKREDKHSNNEIPILTHQEFLETAKTLMENKTVKFYEEDIPDVTEFLHNIGSLYIIINPNDFNCSQMYAIYFILFLYFILSGHKTSINVH